MRPRSGRCDFLDLHFFHFFASRGRRVVVVVLDVAWTLLVLALLTRSSHEASYVPSRFLTFLP